MIGKYLAAAKSGEEVASVPPVVKIGDVSVTTYTVTSGDTLEVIATKQLGSSTRWKELWEINRDRLASPYLLVVGMALYLPAE